MGTSESKDKPHKQEYAVLPSTLSGGPKGLGDPDDKTLRTLEYEKIYKIMREESTKLCKKEDEELVACVKESGIIKCRPKIKALKYCQISWFENKDFEEKCKNQYLDLRSKYRRYGRTAKEEKIFEKWLKEKQENEQHTSHKQTDTRTS